MWQHAAIFFACLALAVPAHAEDARLPQSLRGSIAVYSVQVVDENTSLTIEQRDLLAGNTQSFANFDAGVRGNGGVRGMAWLDGRPWLAGFDVAYVDAISPNLEIRVTPVSFFVGARAPQGIPTGGNTRLHPFVLAGVSTFASWGDAQAGALTSSFRAGRSMLAPGGDNLHAPYLAAGVNISLSRDWSLDIDWRVQHWHVQSIETNSLFLPTRNVLTDISLDASGYAIAIVWTPAFSADGKP